MRQSQSMINRNPKGSNLSIKDRYHVDGSDIRLSSNDNVYLDVQLANDTPNIAIAQYTTTRSNPIVDKADDYYLSVVKFEIPNNDIPLFIFKNNTYAVTMVNAGVSYRQTLSYTSPPGNLPGAIYAIQTFLDSLNEAIAIASGFVGIPVDAIPKVFLDRNNQLQGIRFPGTTNPGAAPIDNWTSPSIGIEPTWAMWMNWELFYFFQTMQVYFTGNFDPVDGRAYRIIVKNNFDGNFLDPATLAPGAYGNYTMTQETPLLSLYISVFSLIIASTLLPVNAELISFKRDSQSATFNTIADFNPGQVANYSDNFTPYLYNPAFYRLVDLNSATPLNKLDFQIFYTDADGNIQPLYLLPSQRMSIKFIFVKKSLYNNQFN